MREASAAAEAESAIAAQATEAASDAAAAAQAAETENATAIQAARAEAIAPAAQAAKCTARGSWIKGCLHMKLPTSRTPAPTMQVPTAMQPTAEPTAELKLMQNR